MFWIEFTLIALNIVILFMLIYIVKNYALL